MRYALKSYWCSMSNFQWATVTIDYSDIPEVMG